MTLYDILGVPKDADPAAIKTAYRKLAQRHHPDKGGDAAVMQAIQKAYDILSNPETRTEYDATGTVDEHKQGIRVQAMSAFAILLGNAASHPDADQETFDLLKQLRAGAAEHAQMVETRLVNMRKQLAKFEKLKSRLKRKDVVEEGNDVAMSFMQEQIDFGKSEIAKADEQQLVIAEIYKLIDLYEYAPGAQIFITNTRTNFGTTFNWLG